LTGHRKLPHRYCVSMTLIFPEPGIKIRDSRGVCGGQ
jgi:hypothetical protein